MAKKATEEQPPIGMVEVKVMGCRCRCGHEWVPHGEERPRVCPKCKSPNWDRPKKFERKK
jgi:predicted Zn-ribbon and HTH transcriptional regulator